MPPQPQDARAQQGMDHDMITSLAAIATGDQSAFTAFYDATSTLVHGMACRMLHDPVAAEDVTMDVYLQVWHQARQYDPQRGRPLTWVLTLTRSRALDRLRSGHQVQQHEQPLEAIGHMPDTNPGPAELSALSQQYRLVHSALQCLAPEQREVIELAYFSGLSCQDIATRLDHPLGTVKTRLRLGMLHLRTNLLPRVDTLR